MDEKDKAQNFYEKNKDKKGKHSPKKNYTQVLVGFLIFILIYLALVLFSFGG